MTMTRPAPLWAAPAAVGAQRLRRAGWACVALACALVAGCASGPAPPGKSGSRGGGYYQKDGPGDLSRLQGGEIQDAVPRVEPLASGPNKPYTVLGRSYVPDTSERPFRQRGTASWYGSQFHGQKTANGERYDMYAMTAAHPTLPIPSYALVTNTANGAQVIVRVNDRGPFLGNRVIDLSYAAAYRLGYLGSGSTEVVVERILPADIVAGRIPTTRPGQGPTAVATARPAAVPAPASVPAPPPAESAPVADDAIDLAAVAPTTPLADDPIARFAQARAIYAPDPQPQRQSRGYFVQMGAFRAREGAQSLAEHLGTELSWLSDRIALTSDADYYRVNAGPYGSRTEAQETAARIRDQLGFTPVVVDRR